MLQGLLADLVFVTHLVFIVWVVLGGCAVVWRPRLAWLHLPAVAWGAIVELAGLRCPLTPLEQQLLHAAGEAGYEGGFIAHYLLPVIYPDGLTRHVQFLLGAVVLVLNIGLYGLLLRRRQRRRGAHGRQSVH